MAPAMRLHQASPTVASDTRPMGSVEHAVFARVVELDFPRADGPARSATFGETAPAGSTQPAPSPSASLASGPSTEPASRNTWLPRSPVALRLVGVLVLVTLWSIVLTYQFNFSGLRHVLAAENSDAVERAATALDNALALNAASLGALAQSLRDDGDLARDLQRAALPGLQQRAERLRQVGGGRPRRCL